MNQKIKNKCKEHEYVQYEHSCLLQCVKCGVFLEDPYGYEHSIVSFLWRHPNRSIRIIFDKDSKHDSDCRRFYNSDGKPVSWRKSKQPYPSWKTCILEKI